MTRGSNHHKALISTSKYRYLTHLDTSWTERGACRGSDPNLWFVDGRPEPKAVAVCETCPVKAQCLHYAIEAGEDFGLWGGMTARKIRDIRVDPVRRMMARIAAEIEAEKEAG